LQQPTDCAPSYVSKYGCPIPSCAEIEDASAPDASGEDASAPDASDEAWSRRRMACGIGWQGGSVSDEPLSQVDERQTPRSAAVFVETKRGRGRRRGAVLTYGDEPRRRDRAGIGEKRRTSAPTAGLEPATRRLTDEGGAAKREKSRDPEESQESESDDPDPACFAAFPHDSSGIVNEVRVECITGVGEHDRAARTTPADVESAIRTAIKLAVEAGDYGCVKTLLQLLDRTGR
jgi:hypothetical protein